MKSRLLVAVVSLLAGTLALADDWPQFRGPERTGVSKEKGLLKAWPKEGPKLAWTFKDAGLGFSSVSVANGVVYTLGTDKDCLDEYVIAIDEKSGKQLWTAKIGPLYTYKGNTYGDGPRSTPTIDGKLLFALGGQGDLVCIDIRSKKEVWRKNLVKDLGGVLMQKYGFSEAPLVDGDLLICTPGGPNGTLAALDKKTGKVEWRSKGLTHEATYSSAIVAEIHGVRQYLVLSYRDDMDATFGAISGISGKGDVLWTQQIFKGSSDGVTSTPVVIGNQVYVSAGFGAGSHLFALELKDAKWKATEQFDKSPRLKVKNLHGGVVLIDGHIYGHSEQRVWFCQDTMKGALKWDERNALKCSSGSITAAEGLLYLYTDEGKVGLVGANPAAFNLISSFEIPERSKLGAGRKTHKSAYVWAHPVIANGHLYLRDQEYIFAYKIADK